MKWRVVWLCMKTGIINHSKPIARRNAVEAATLGNQLYSRSEHWIEQAYKMNYKVES